MSRTAILFRTELSLWFRNFSSVFFTLVFPVLLLVIFGNVFGSQTLPGSSGTMIDMMVPAYCVLIVGMTGLMSFPMDAADNIARHVYKRYDAAPVGKNAVIGCEFTVNLLMTLIGVIILLSAASAFFSFSAQGSIIGIAGTLALSTVCLFSMGFLIVVACPSPRMAQGLCYALYFFMIFLSGATLPRLLFPDALMVLSDWLPMTYAVDLVQNAFLGAPCSTCITDVIVLSVTSAGCLVVGALLFARRDWAR